MKKIAISTLGCKVNQYESACIADSLVKEQCILVDFDAIADIYVINTCTVTNRSDFKSRNLIRQALKVKECYPDTIIIVTGCYAQNEFDKTKKLGNIDLIVDNNNKAGINNLIKSATAYRFEGSDSFKEFSEQSTDTMMDRSRALVKIQDGCNFFCSYCAVPYARGKPRSRSINSIIKQIDRYTDNGFKEIVLSGINLGLFGTDNGSDLIELLTALETNESLKLIRISSIEPQFITKDLVSFISKSKKLCPHLHIPLQSGSNRILEKMKRRYTIEFFKNMVQELKKINPCFAIGIDLIAGFPSESENDFKQSLAFIEELDFSYAHVFPFSQRKNTPAYNIEPRVNGHCIRKRCALLRKISSLKNSSHIKKLIAEKKILRGIVEKKADGLWTFLSDHYTRAYFSAESDMHRELASIIPVGKIRNGIIGNCL